MTRLLLALKWALVCSLILLTPRAQACEMPEGFHEYGTFGKQAVYLYHFPMFGSIHSYQVLLEVDLSVGGNNVNEDFFSARAANPGALFITSPAKASDGAPDYWVLPEYSKVGAVFSARLHYRDNGKDVDVFTMVQVRVKKVILNRLLKSTNSRPESLSYFYFGGGTEGYLLHSATWDPDFDQALEISPLALSPTTLVISGRPNGEATRLKAGETASATGDANSRYAIHVLNQLFEFPIELQH